MSEVVGTVQPKMVRTGGVVTCHCGFSADLGWVSVAYKNPLRHAWWTAFGKPAADRRIAAWNRHRASHNLESGAST